MPYFALNAPGSSRSLPKFSSSLSLFQSPRMQFLISTLFYTLLSLLSLVVAAPSGYYQPPPPPSPQPTPTPTPTQKPSPPPLPTPSPEPVTSRCSTGPIQCCNSVQDADHQSVSDIFSLLGGGGILSGITGQVGMACSPVIGGEGLGGSPTCMQQTVCCENTQFSTYRYDEFPH
ncbi:hypothetical protein HGRIS_014445 [Hohenbuehelia grisea]|uniref:Hydrophobin n=1 Tax=Hohenbuehelia grisea TaxID=104357 RepID=A0ABR3JUW2_9AGAR